jgi:hypothetical protein
MLSARLIAALYSLVVATRAEDSSFAELFDALFSDEALPVAVAAAPTVTEAPLSFDELFAALGGEAGDAAVVGPPPTPAPPAPTDAAGPAPRFLVSVANVERREESGAAPDASPPPAATLFCLDRAGALPIAATAAKGEPWPCARWIAVDSPDGSAVELRSRSGIARVEGDGELCLAGMDDGAQRVSASVRARRCAVDRGIAERYWKLAASTETGAADGALRIVSNTQPTLCVVVAPLRESGASQLLRRALRLENCDDAAADAAEPHRALWWWSDVAPLAARSADSVAPAAAAAAAGASTHVERVPWWLRSVWELRAARKTRSVLRQVEDKASSMKRSLVGAGGVGTVALAVPPLLLQVRVGSERTLTLSLSLSAPPLSVSTSHSAPPSLSRPHCTQNDKKTNPILFIAWRVDALVTLDEEAARFSQLHPALTAEDTRRRAEQASLRAAFGAGGEIGECSFMYRYILRESAHNLTRSP